MTDMSPDEIAEARRIIEAATPGPWKSEKVRTLLHITGERIGVCSISVSANHVHEDYPGCKREYITRQETNAAFIAAARTGWPKALDEIERLRSDAEAARDEAVRLLRRAFPYIDDAEDVQSIFPESVLSREYRSMVSDVRAFLATQKE